MIATTYETAGGIRVHRTVDEIPVANAIEPVVQALDAHRGVLLASSYEYPGRYKRWDMGFVDPPLALTARNRDFRVQALNPRGRVLLAPILHALQSLDAVERASSALAASGAVLLDGRRLADGLLEVTYRFMGERFRAVVQAGSLQVVDAGICLSGHDAELTLDSLPPVIREGSEDGVLVITSHV